LRALRRLKVNFLFNFIDLAEISSLNSALKNRDKFTSNRCKATQGTLRRPKKRYIGTGFWTNYKFLIAGGST
jgi:hypothetical protein